MSNFIKNEREMFEEFWTDMYFRLERFEPHKPMLPAGETADEVKSFLVASHLRLIDHILERMGGEKPELPVDSYDPTPILNRGYNTRDREVKALLEQIKKELTQ